MSVLPSVWPQFRLAARSLRRRPGLSLLAILTLALGIGANTAIFSAVNAILLEPLPFEEPERLVMAWSTAPGQGVVDGFASYPDFRDWRNQASSFAGLAAFWTFPNGDVNLTGGQAPERVSVARVTPGFFEVLGIVPLHGRTFQAEESIAGNHRRAILSHRLWQRQFGADPALVGRSVSVNGFPYTVVGIMPPIPRVRAVGLDVDLWRPLVPDDNQTGGRDQRKLRVIGRLAGGVSVAQAGAELGQIAARLGGLYPETNREVGGRVVALREQVVQDARRGLMLLLGAVGVVLLGACVNVANLLLIKAAASRREMAVQQALGASRARLASQVLIESLILGGVGAGLGLLVAFGGVRAFVAAGPRSVPLLADVRIDAGVLAFTLIATVLTVLVVGLVPAWRAARSDGDAALRQGAGRGLSGDDRRVMGSLGVAQIALAMVLLSAGGLLVRSFQALLRVDPGLDPARILTLQLELPMATTYPSQAGRDGFFATLLERVREVPGVTGVTLANAPPLEEEPSLFTFARPGVADGEVVQANYRLVAPNYFSLLGIPVVEGRAFEPGDGRLGRRVVIVSRALARAAWGAESPVGARIQHPFAGALEVVGVVGDVRIAGLDGAPSRIAYTPALQAAYNFMTVIVKSRRDPYAVVPAIRALVNRLDPDLPLHRVRSVGDLLATSVAPQRFQMLLVGAFSLLVFVLAIVGIYGVASYGVSERTGELGIRVALGATGGDIRRLVLREAAVLAAVGIAIGGVGAALLSRVLSRFVFQISALDPVTFAVTPLILAAALLAAAFVPARRATRADPMQALRLS